MDKERVLSILQTLKREYPDAAPELKFKNEFELLIAAILSAQSTDKQVNRVTKRLFEEYPSPHAFVRADLEDIETAIRSCGFFRMKAKNIKNACAIIVEDFNGQVPNTQEALMTLPGVGRKVANVVVSNAFGVPAIAVDTHVFRVANRIGLAHAKNELNTEKQLMEAIPKDLWSIAHHQLIFHGRRVCGARSYNCEECAINNLCEKNIKTDSKE